MDILSTINIKGNLRKVGNSIVEDTTEPARKIIDELIKTDRALINIDYDALVKKIDSGEELIEEWIDIRNRLVHEREGVEPVPENVLFSILRPPKRYGISWLSNEERGVLKDGISSLIASKRLSYRAIQISGRIVLSKYFLENSRFGIGDELIVPINSIMLGNEYFDSFGSGETFARMNGECGGIIIGKFNDGMKNVGHILIKGASENKCLRIYRFDRNIRDVDEAEIYINVIEGVKYKDEQGNWIP